MNKISPVAAASLAMLMSCHSNKQVVQQELAPAPVAQTTVKTTAPRAFVYRTKADYSNNVPVMLNASKTEIVSYPARTDVANKPVPTPLGDGWLLDNRGIGLNVAYTSYTYDEYVALPATPSRADLMEHIIDKNPLVEAWLCEPRYVYHGKEQELLGALIKAGFPGCDRVK